MAGNFPIKNSLKGGKFLSAKMTPCDSEDRGEQESAHTLLKHKGEQVPRATHHPCMLMAAKSKSTAETCECRMIVYSSFVFYCSSLEPVVCLMCS